MPHEIDLGHGAAGQPMTSAQILRGRLLREELAVKERQGREQADVWLEHDRLAQHLNQQLAQLREESGEQLVGLQRGLVDLEQVLSAVVAAWPTQASGSPAGPCCSPPCPTPPSVDASPPSPIAVAEVIIDHTKGASSSSNRSPSRFIAVCSFGFPTSRPVRFESHCTQHLSRGPAD